MSILYFISCLLLMDVYIWVVLILGYYQIELPSPFLVNICEHFCGVELLDKVLCVCSDFLDNCQNSFQSGCTSLHFHHQYMIVLVAFLANFLYCPFKKNFFLLYCYYLTVVLFCNFPVTKLNTF